MELLPFDKLVITQMNEQINVHVIGIRPEPDGSITYAVESLRKDFIRSKTGSRIMRINSKEIESKSVNIEKHTV